MSATHNPVTERLRSVAAIHRERSDGAPARSHGNGGMQATGNRNLARATTLGRDCVHTFDEARGSKHWFLYARGADRRREAELPREPDTLKRVDAEPVDIKLIPCEAVSDAAWIGMVVVMPALAKRQ